MILATYAKHPSDYSDVLKESASFHGYKLIVLDHPAHMADFLTTLPANEIVVFMDAASDTVVLRPNCLETFLQIHEKGKVLFSAGHSGWVMDFMFGCHHTKEPSHHYNSINTGLYMGYVRDLMCLFEKFQSARKENHEDPYAIDHYYYRQMGQEHIQLDTQCQIFYHLEWQLPACLVYVCWMLGVSYDAPLICPHYSMEINGQLTVVRTNTQPVFIQGNRNMDMGNLMDYLDWQVAKKQKRAHWYSYWKDTLTYLSYTLWQILKRTITNLFSHKTLPPPSTVPRNMIFKVDPKTGRFMP